MTMRFDEERQKSRPAAERDVRKEPKKKLDGGVIFGTIMAGLVFTIGIVISLGIVTLTIAGIYKTLEWMMAL